MVFRIFSIILTLSTCAWAADDAPTGPVAPSNAIEKCKTALTPGDVFEKRLARVKTDDIEAIAQSKENIEETMNDLGLTSPEDRHTYSASVQLRPLLESGVIYQAIAEELVARKFGKWRDIETMLNFFPLLPPAEKRDLIENILENVHFAIGKLADGVQISEVSLLRKKAKQFEMTEARFSAFLLHWNEIGLSDYAEAKLALLDQFLMSTSTFKAQVRSAFDEQTSWWGRRKRRNDKKRERLNLNSNGNIDSSAVYAYVSDSASTQAKAKLVTRHLDRLDASHAISIKTHYTSVYDARSPSSAFESTGLSKNTSRVASLSKRFTSSKESLGH